MSKIVRFHELGDADVLKIEDLPLEEGIDSIAPSNGSCPAWLQISSTRPSGIFSIPCVSARK